MVRLFSIVFAGGAFCLTLVVASTGAARASGQGSCTMNAEVIAQDGGSVRVALTSVKQEHGDGMCSRAIGEAALGPDAEVFQPGTQLVVHGSCHHGMGPHGVVHSCGGWRVTAATAPAAAPTAATPAPAPSTTAPPSTTAARGGCGCATGAADGADGTATAALVVLLSLVALKAKPGRGSPIAHHQDLGIRGRPRPRRSAAHPRGR
jgi:hypothetical protein